MGNFVIFKCFFFHLTAKCNGPNEQFYPCARPCDAKTCSYYINRPPCPTQAADAKCVNGKPQCDCVDGYARQTPTDQCEPQDDCLNQIIEASDYDLDTPLTPVNIPATLNEDVLAGRYKKF